MFTLHSLQLCSSTLSAHGIPWQDMYRASQDLGLWVILHLMKCCEQAIEARIRPK